RIFRHRQQFNRAAAFSNCVLLVTESSVSHPEHTKPFSVIRLLCDELGPLGSRVSKCNTRCRFIPTQLSHYAFTPKSRNRNSVVVTPIDRQRIHSHTRANGIASRQASAQPNPR